MFNKCHYTTIIQVCRSGNALQKLMLYLSYLGLKNDAVEEVVDFINFKDYQAKGLLRKDKLQ